MKVFLFVVSSLITSFNIGFSQVSFKNNTSKSVNVAILSYVWDDWRVTGWHTIPSGETQALILSLKNRYCYYFAFSDDKTWSGNDTKAWVGKKGLFMTDTKTNFDGDSEYTRVGFKLVDVGEKGIYTVTLDLRSDFILNLESYLKSPKLDPMEGLYTISDEVTIDYNNLLYQDEKKNLDHWAKIAIIKDTVNLTRNYVQFVLEGKGFKEGEVMAEYLQTKQSPTLFISDQLITKDEAAKNVMVEFLTDEDKLTTEFKFETKDAILNVKRTYLKYYPKN